MVSSGLTVDRASEGDVTRPGSGSHIQRIIDDDITVKGDVCPIADISAVGGDGTGVALRARGGDIVQTDVGTSQTDGAQGTVDCRTGCCCQNDIAATCGNS